MKRFGLISTAVLSLTLGVTAPAYAQREQQGEKQDHPKQEQGKHEQARPEQHHAQQQRPQQHAQQPQRQGHNAQPEHARQQSDRARQPSQHAQQPQRQAQERHEQHAQQQRRNQPPQRTQERQRVQHSAWQQHRSQHWDSDHRTWQQRGGYHGYRIPEYRFRGYFGPDHGFRIHGRPFLVVGGYPRFQYSGYWFSLVDPWPEYWANDWYDTDEVYVTYVDNGYYMFNRRYPTVGIAISISR